MANSEKRNREKILAVITLIVVISALTFIIIIEPQLTERKKCLEHLHQLQLKLTKMRNAVRMKDRTDKIYSDYEPFIKSSGEGLHDALVFTRELQSLYGNLKVGIKTVTISPTVKEEFFKQLSVRIEMSGSIKEILTFICSIEEDSTPIHIELLEIIPQEITDNVKASFIITKVVAEADK